MRPFLLALVLALSLGCGGKALTPFIGAPQDRLAVDCVVNAISWLTGRQYQEVAQVRATLGLEWRPLTAEDALLITIQLNPPRSAAILADEAWRACQPQP